MATAIATSVPMEIEISAPTPEDTLAVQELSLFGSVFDEIGLPAPPYDPNKDYGLGPGVGAAARRQFVANANRAKRPKNVKLSPVKPKNGGRRTIGMGSDTETGLPNNDYCDACHGKGQFLCCEGGCLRSFHFNCLDPPVELDDLPDESWFCKSCRSELNPPAREGDGMFTELVHRVACINPKAFALPIDIKTFYRDVAVGAHGDFIDTNEHRLTHKVTGKPLGGEDRDGYRLKDKSGKTILCFNCNESASIPKRRRILSCDFCDQHWHLDCLSPPMTGMPPSMRKWMCPVHADHVLPKVRQPARNTTTLTIDKRYTPNNGDISILPRREYEKIADEFDELTVNRIRYQVPEETVILDFWARAQGVPRPLAGAQRIRKSLFDQLEAMNGSSSRPGESPNSGGASPLTSLGDEDSDSEVIYKPAKAYSALDELLEAHNHLADSESHRQATIDAMLLAASSPHSPALPTSPGPSTTSKQPSASSGLVIRLPARNVGTGRDTTKSNGAQESTSTNGGPSSSILGTRVDKGKGRELESRVEAVAATRTPSLPISAIPQYNGSISNQFTGGKKNGTASPIDKKSPAPFAIPPFRGVASKAPPTEQELRRAKFINDRATLTTGRVATPPTYPGSGVQGFALAPASVHSPVIATPFSSLDTTDSTKKFMSAATASPSFNIPPFRPSGKKALAIPPHNPQNRDDNMDTSN